MSPPTARARCSGAGLEPPVSEWALTARGGATRSGGTLFPGGLAPSRVGACARSSQAVLPAICNRLMATSSIFELHAAFHTAAKLSALDGT